jgi:hypothetical protein
VDAGALASDSAQKEVHIQKEARASAYARETHLDNLEKRHMLLWIT